MSVDIRGKWALLTGAARGVGKQVALGLAQRGCNLVLHSRDRAHTADLEKDLLALGVKVASVAAELSRADEVDRMVDAAMTASGGLDILYSNAAVMTRYRNDWTAAPPEDFRTSFEVNVIAPIQITTRLLPRMLQQRWGRIVHVTSGIRDQPELMAYAASKAALDKFVRDAAPRLRGTGVLMNLLDPGWLRTDLGGPSAPNPVESVLPGALAPVLLDGEVHGSLFAAQDYAGKALG